jgi:hypothetical protein
VVALSGALWIASACHPASDSPNDATDAANVDAASVDAIGTDPNKDITSFWFKGDDNPSIGYDADGRIQGTEIAVNVPYNTNVSTLIASFKTSGASVKIGSTPQASGVTPNDFAHVVTYTVTAANTTTKDYTVRVSVAPGLYPGTTFADQTDPYSFALGDMNGDGSTDVVIANFKTDSISVFRNATSPGASMATLSANADFTTGAGPRGVAVADFNSDGKLDVAAANTTADTVSVLLNTTTTTTSPTFATKVDVSIPGAPIALAAVDVNADGKPDLVVANYTASSVSVLLNTTTANASTPTFATKVNFSTTFNVQSLTTGDLNADGKPDLAVAGASGYVSILLNTTTANATSPAFATSVDVWGNPPPVSIASSVAIGDLNGDGTPDLAVANNYANTVSVLLNKTTPNASTPSFSMPTAFATQWSQFDPSTGRHPRAVAIHDFNGDGAADLAVGCEDDFGVVLFVNTGDPAATTPRFSAPFFYLTDMFATTPWGLATGDFNADAKADLAVLNHVGSVSILIAR